MNYPRRNPDASLLRLYVLDISLACWHDLAHPESRAGNAALPLPLTVGGLKPRKSDRSIYCLDRTSNRVEPVESTGHS